MKREDPHPWYREPWPWILMAGPAIVVVAGIATAAIAVATNDGLVADDYYRQGLAINKVIAREERARSLGLTAALQFGAGRVRVLITSGAPQAEPPRLTLVHATRAGLDRTIVLASVAPGIYEGAVGTPAQGLWRVQLEDARAAWRLTGHWRSAEASTTLAPAAR